MIESAKAQAGADAGRRWYREISLGQWGVLIGVWCVWALDAFDFLLVTFVLTDIAKAFGVASSTASLLILATFGVRWLGGLMFGSLSDRIGRKIPLLIALAWFTVGGALTGIAWSFASILVFRLLLGFGMAPIFALGSTIIAETWPEKHRAIGIGMLDAGWGIGAILAAIVYGLVYPHFGWRVLFFVGIVPSVVLGWLLYRFLPESPMWQRSQKQGKASGRWPAFRLFAEHPRLVLILALMLIFLQFAAWPLQGLLPTFLKGLNFSAATIGWLTSASAVGQIFGFSASGFVVEYLGRKKGLALLLILGSASVYALVSSVNIMPLSVVFAFFSGFFIVGAGGCYATIIAENLPGNVRGSGVGFIYNIGVFGGGIAPYVVLSSIRTLHLDMAIGIWVFTLIGVLLGLAIIFGFVKETKGVSLLHVE